jgi:hypothetical protein
MDIHQCPRCELRFANTSELRHHFEFDHAADPSVFERYRYRSSAPGEPGRTVLLVGNQSLDREGLVEEVARRAGGSRVLVLVPATPRSEQVVDGHEPPSGEPGDAPGVALARWRLRTTVERLREAGLDADGEVGDEDPYTAICHVLGHEAVDEVLISTLPASSSRWLSVDLPGRLRRHSSRPVTVLTPVATDTA